MSTDAANVSSVETDRLTVAKLAHERALDAVKIQSERVERIRNRSLAALGVVVTICSFVVSEAVTGSAGLREIFGGAGILLLILSGAMIVLAGLILKPYDMILEDDAGKLLDKFGDQPAVDVYSRLARSKMKHWQRNAAVEDLLWWFLRLQFALSVVVVVGWFFRAASVG